MAAAASSVVGAGAQPLELCSVVCFSGEEDTLLYHQDEGQLIYALGSTVVLRDKNDAKAQVGFVLGAWP